MSALYDKGVKQSDRIAGVIAIIAYILLLVLFVVFTRFSIDNKFIKEVQSSGILMSFGNQTLGDGARVTNESQEVRNIPKATPKIDNTPKQRVETAPTEAVINDNSEDAVIAAVEKKKIISNKAISEKSKKEKSERKDIKSVKEVKSDITKPVVNKGALYKKRNSSETTTTSNDTSSGIAKNRDGKSGSKTGDLGVAGGGGEGDNFSLVGRSLMGALEPPVYSERVSGRIIIEIQVNRDGKVIAASFNPKNSTISSRSIIEAVRKVAMKAQFNADPMAAFTQVGTITYLLKVE